MQYLDSPTNIVILGASGDLTRKKLVPALFSLYCDGLLPREFHLFGFARSRKSDREFRTMVGETITTRHQPDPSVCDIRISEFLQRCYYHSGQYDSTDDFRKLRKRLDDVAPRSNLLVFLAIPPSIFLKTANSLRGAGLVEESGAAWSRVVVEKPFGRDTESSLELTNAMGKLFSEAQTYRIDHYLGKEVIQNLLLLRFGNQIFEPIWNRNHIESVTITFSEKIGVEGRAGYFDQFGIIRDVVQNHLLQAMALVAMEQPIRMDAAEIAEEKTKLLRATCPMDPVSTVTGQYEGYLSDPDVPDNSVTETFVCTNLCVNNARWHGVPFYLSAGKALDTQKTEIILRFRPVPFSIFGDIAENTMVIRVQPNESIELRVNNKVPGVQFQSSSVPLNMLYHEEFDAKVPEAYERLLLDVLRGDRSLFIQRRELSAAWQIVTPFLKLVEEKMVRPKQYAYGSTGPER